MYSLFVLLLCVTDTRHTQYTLITMATCLTMSESCTQALAVTVEAQCWRYHQSNKTVIVAELQLLTSYFTDALSNSTGS